MRYTSAGLSSASKILGIRHTPLDEFYAPLKIVFRVQLLHTPRVQNLTLRPVSRALAFLSRITILPNRRQVRVPGRSTAPDSVCKDSFTARLQPLVCLRIASRTGPS